MHLSKRAPILVFLVYFSYAQRQRFGVTHFVAAFLILSLLCARSSCDLCSSKEFIKWWQYQWHRMAALKFNDKIRRDESKSDGLIPKQQSPPADSANRNNGVLRNPPTIEPGFHTMILFRTISTRSLY